MLILLLALSESLVFFGEKSWNTVPVVPQSCSLLILQPAYV